MFVLNPGGSGSGAKGGASSVLSQNVWFFGQLALYFAVLRGAFWYMAGPEERRALQNPGK